MRNKYLLLSSIIAALSVVPAQVTAIADERHIEVTPKRRTSSGSKSQTANFGRTYPRSRKTTTAAQLKRAATKRRNIEKRK